MKIIQGHRLDYRVDQGVARITMAAPDARNAVDRGWCQSFAEVTRECSADPAIRVVVLAAQGEVFSVGGDLDHFVSARARIAAEAFEMTQLFHAGLMRLAQGRAPVVSAVQGVAAGGGLSLALSGDLVIASRRARFVTAYSRSGLTPDGGLTWWLPRIVGARKAFELLALNETLDADQALAAGLITRVCEHEQLDDTVSQMVNQLLGMSAAALAGLKRLMALSAASSLAEQFEHESAMMADTLVRPETSAMLDAFLARRQARPKGQS
jgi:2-(1,2-epoxy-1,2-dihydrophenyl)acetyl-CoA isomerase